MTLSSVSFAVHTPYSRNGTEKSRVEKHLQLVVGSANVNLRRAHRGQIRLDSFGLKISNSKFGNLTSQIE